MCNKLPPTGYTGQDYVVKYKDSNNRVKVFGWTNDSTGGALVRSINLHPVMHSPEVLLVNKEFERILDRIQLNG